MAALRRAQRSVLEDALRKLPRGSGFIYRHYHLAPEGACALVRVAPVRSITRPTSSFSPTARSRPANGAPWLYGAPRALYPTSNLLTSRPRIRSTIGLANGPARCGAALPVFLTRRILRQDARAASISSACRSCRMPVSRRRHDRAHCRRLAWPAGLRSTGCLGRSRTDAKTRRLERRGPARLCVLRLGEQTENLDASPRKDDTAEGKRERHGRRAMTRAQPADWRAAFRRSLARAGSSRGGRARLALFLSLALVSYTRLTLRLRPRGAEVANWMGRPAPGSPNARVPVRARRHPADPGALRHRAQAGATPRTRDAARRPLVAPLALLLLAMVLRHGDDAGDGRHGPRGLV